MNEEEGMTIRGRQQHSREICIIFRITVGNYVNPHNICLNQVRLRRWRLSAPAAAIRSFKNRSIVFLSIFMYVFLHFSFSLSEKEVALFVASFGRSPFRF